MLAESSALGTNTGRFRCSQLISLVSTPQSCLAMSLADLDAFLLMRAQDPELERRFGEPMDLEQFLALAAERGFQLTEADVFAAQQREQAGNSAALQREQAKESRRLRNFIHG